MASLSELLHAASRTFAIGIELLPEPLRAEVRVAYLLLRVSDYLEDNEEMDPDEKVRLLVLWERVLAAERPVDEIEGELVAASDPTPDAMVARHVREVVEGADALEAGAREIVLRHVRDSTLGMARWVERGPDFRVEEDLDDYMHEVAGRVGYLLTDLFARHSARIRAQRDGMRELAREFGLALQTVNVIRGLHHDRERGWVYIPRSFVAGDVRLPEIFEPGNREAAIRVLDRLVAKADTHLAAAREYVRRIPRRHHRIRLFCLLPLLFAVRTMAISRSNPDVFERETKIPRREVRSITRWSTLLGFSNTWVEWYCRRLGGGA